MGEQRIIHFHTCGNHVAYEPQRAVPHQSAWQETGFTQNLEPVARAEHKFAGARVADHCFHDRGKPSDRAATKIITICESSR